MYKLFEGDLNEAETCSSDIRLCLCVWNMHLLLSRMSNSIFLTSLCVLNEELNDLYSSPNIVRVIKSRRMRWAGHVARMGEERGVYRVLVGKPEGKRPLGRPRRRWVDNIRMDLQEVGCGYMDWIGLAQDRDRWRKLVSAVMNLRVPWNAGNFLSSCKPVSFSRRTLHHGVSKYLTVFIFCGYSLHLKFKTNLLW